MTTTAKHFQVSKADWRNTRIVESEIHPPGDGEVLFRVDRFALTSNNITYALAGDLLDYWGFFPTGADGWGRIPAMGFGEIIESKHREIRAGQRFFGFFPMSTHHTIAADRVTEESFVDSSPHRAQHAPVYVQFANTARDPFYAADREDQHMLLRGLFVTSFLADDCLADRGFHGASSVIVSSASSKTAIALAFQLAARNDVSSIGLTSARNRDFVQSLGLYDEVRTYNEVDSLDPDVKSGIVDMAGSADLTRRLHRHFGDRLEFDCSIGATHWDSGGPADDDLPGAKPEFFFAPSQIQKRNDDWGPVELQRRIGTAWHRFSASTDQWLDIRRGLGPASVQAVYAEMLDGSANPARGHVLSVWQPESP